MSWPKSLPDYRWPEGVGSGPRRWISGAIFFLAYLLGLIASPLRRGRKILIIRTDGLGDAVLSEPMIRAVAERYPAAQIHLWAPASTCELFSAAAYVHIRRIIPRGFKDGCLQYFSSAPWHWKMGWNFGRYRFDIAIYPAISPEPFGNWIFATVRADKHWIVKGDLFHQFESQQRTTLQSASRIFAKPRPAHELQRNNDLAWQYGANEVPRWPMISIDAGAYEQANSFLSRWQSLAKRARANGMVGVVVAGSMKKFAWPAEKWAETIAEIWSTHRLMPVFLSPSIALDERIPSAELEGKVSVLGLAAILREMDLVLTLDTGPAHIAAALRVPTVVLSNGGHPGRFFPWPEADWVKTVVHRMPCEGCICRCALAEAECLTRIDVSDVMAAVGQLRPRTAKRAA